MKTATSLIVIALASALSVLSARGATSDEIPPASDLGRASVTIPYSELRALWEAGHRSEAAPKPEVEALPIPFVVHRAEYRLVIGEQSSALDAEYEVESLNKGWQSIPLVGGEVSLDKAEAGDRAVIWKDGYVLLASQPGKSPAALHLAAPGVRKLIAPGVLKLRIGSATINRLAISGAGEGMEARVNCRPASEIKDGVALFHLPSEAGEISIELAAPKAEAPPKPPQRSQWRAQSQVLARYEDGRLRFQARLSAHADDGSGTELDFALPSNASSITVAGEDVIDSTVGRTDDGKQRNVHVRWKTPDILDREIAMIYEAPQSPLGEQWILPAPGIAEDKDARNLFAVVCADGLELKGEGVQASVAAQRLPQWMREGIGGAAFVTAEAGGQLALQARWLPTVATADAIVSEAKGELQLVVDGSMQMGVTYSIRHSAPLAWQVELPPSVELLSCLVNGHAARPILRESGALEVPLPTPAGKEASTVTLVYSAKAKSLDPVSGQIALEMPRTPLFIEHLEWLVTIPELFEITALDGNATAARAPAGGPASAARSPNVINLRKDFCRGERPAVALFYQRHNIEK